MPIDFTAHNIRLDDGTLTKPDASQAMNEHPWFVSAKRVLDTVFPGEREHLRIADLGCLEGGYSVEFARLGFQVLGIEVRESNIAACNYVKSKINLPNLSFVKDNALNVASYGMFDAVFCCGLLYHLDRPKEFIELLSSVTRKLVILQTHFAADRNGFSLAAALRGRYPWCGKFNLSKICENEGVPGRWFTEFGDQQSFNRREANRWASWDNRKSFWMQREYLIEAIHKAGFDTVMECFDSLGPNIADNMTRGYYQTDTRGTFIGIKA